MIFTIVAVDENWGIGKDNQLLCRIPNDLKRFKNLTEGNIVIMGRGTFESLGRKTLPNRTNIIITHNTQEFGNPNTHNEIFMGMDEAKKYIATYCGDKNIFIIGGESIYKQLLPLCSAAFVTKIHKSFSADRFFPNLDADVRWKCISDSAEVNNYGDLWYSYHTYEYVV
jgi:dihydrofolate reductase